MNVAYLYGYKLALFAPTQHPTTMQHHVNNYAPSALFGAAAGGLGKYLTDPNASAGSILGTAAVTGAGMAGVNAIYRHKNNGANMSNQPNQGGVF